MLVTSPFFFSKDEAKAIVKASSLHLDNLILKSLNKMNSGIIG